jgi:hypothetical protein
MSKTLDYAIEGNINFQDELKKLLNEDDNDDNICQITGIPLTDKFVILECNHKFNYEALYKELMNQRYKYKNYNLNTFTASDRQKFINSKATFFVRCPYCRNIQFNVIPYYEELGLKKEYGLNSLEKGLRNPLVLPGYNTNPNACIFHKGLVFKNIPGVFCDHMNVFGDICINSYLYNIPNTQLHYCCNHYSEGCKKYKKEQIKIKKDLKLVLKKEKEDILNTKKKQLEDINNERIQKGLNPLKRLPKSKENNAEPKGCSAILKSGVNKGTACGSLKIDKDGLCKRHAQK